MTHWILESEVDPQHYRRDRYWIASSGNPELALATGLTKEAGELLVSLANARNELQANNAELTARNAELVSALIFIECDAVLTVADAREIATAALAKSRE